MFFYHPNFALILVIILISLSIHECAHALVAHWLGDDTAKQQGRLTLNPISHLDPIGSLMFLVLQIGWGKPVPINPSNFKNPRQAQALVAIAGPLSNIILASLLNTLNLHFKLNSNFLDSLIEFNILLAAFNLIPLPPLDGSKILNLLLPSHIFYKFQNFTQQNLGYIILIIFLDLNLLGPHGYSIFRNIIQILTIAIKSIVLI